MDPDDSSIALSPSDGTKNIAGSKSQQEKTIGDTVRKLLQEGQRSTEDQPDPDPEIYKAALDAVRFEHQRLQNEFMTLMVLNEHVQQKLDSLSDSNLNLEMDLNLRENN